jgi:hypothetical protein
VTRTARVLGAVALLLGASACLPTHQQTAGEAIPTAASEWPRTYAQAMIDAREARTAAAEQALTGFAQRFPGSPEASEVPYWRAVLKLDPNNPASSHDALALLDAYLADAPSGLHRAEATTLRRLEAALEARTAALAAQPTAPSARPEDKARDEELVRLRDELAKANAELTRIKRRLARPKP